MNPFRKIEKFLLWALTAGRRASFYCDSHPTLCVQCRRVRHLLSGRKLPRYMVIKTMRGPYLWGLRGELHDLKVFEDKRPLSVHDIARANL